MIHPRNLICGVILFQLSISNLAYGSEQITPPSLGQPRQEQDVRQSLFELDTKLLLECIELARFSINFREAANKHWRWRAVLYPMAQEAGTACSFSNGLIDLRERIKGYNDPGLKSSRALKQGRITSIVGSCISGSSSASELTQNLIVDWLARQKGYSPENRIKFVKARIGSIDARLAERAKLVSSSTMSDQDRQVKFAEGIMLHRIRNQLLAEFRRVSTRSQEYMCQANTSFFINSSQNFTQLASSLFALKAFGSPQLDGTASIVSLSAGTMGALNPTLSWMAGASARRLHRRQLLKAFGPQPTSNESDVSQQLNDAQVLLAANDPDGIDIRELAFLQENSERLDNVLDREQRGIFKLRRVAAQQAIAGPIIGMTSVSRSILSTVGYYDYRGEPIVRNRIGLAGRITSLTGQSYSLVKTPSTQIHNLLAQRRLRQQDMLPEQISARQLKQLDALEVQLKAGKF